jgi:hypothetical protein
MSSTFTLAKSEIDENSSSEKSYCTLGENKMFIKVVFVIEFFYTCEPSLVDV